MESCVPGSWLSCQWKKARQGSGPEGQLPMRVSHSYPEVDISMSAQGPGRSPVVMPTYAQ